MIHRPEKICPRCGFILKSWSELDDEQRMLAERLPMSAEYTTRERKKHRFCTRCWFELSSLDSEDVV